MELNPKKPFFLSFFEEGSGEEEEEEEELGNDDDDDDGIGEVDCCFKVEANISKSVLAIWICSVSSAKSKRSLSKANQWAPASESRAD